MRSRPARQGVEVSAQATAIRPKLRGWIHAAAVPLAVVGAWTLWEGSQPETEPRISVLVFGLGLIGLFATSSLYHVPDWTPRAKRILGRCDAAMIQLFIAATFTPFAVHALEGAWQSWTLIVAWSVAVVGAAIALSPFEGPRWLTAACYVAFGWLGAVPMLRVARAIPWEGTALVAAGGVLYTIGSLVYARRTPDPSPEWFGYHEVFHVLVVAAGSLHFLAIWRFALPLA